MHLSDVKRQSGSRRLRLPRDVTGNGVHRGGTQAGLDRRNGQWRCQNDPEGRADLRFAAFPDRARKTLGLASHTNEKSLKWENWMSLKLLLVSIVAFDEIREMGELMSWMFNRLFVLCCRRFQSKIRSKEWMTMAHKNTRADWWKDLQIMQSNVFRARWIYGFTVALRNGPYFILLYREINYVTSCLNFANKMEKWVELIIIKLNLGSLKRFWIW